jgi:excisionase family DNA binding protein
MALYSRPGEEAVAVKQYVSTPLLSVAEAAGYLGVRRRLVYQLIENGEIRAVKMGRAVLIEERSLWEFKTSGKMV